MGAGKKGALDGRWVIAFLDESGATLEPLVGRTWSPIGDTPILRHNFGRWTKVNLISAVTHTGRLLWQMKPKDSFRQPDIVRFLRHLKRHVRKDVVLFYDRGGPHRGPILREYLAKVRGLRVEYLPPYAFEYNPDEQVWSHLKWATLRNSTPHNRDELLITLRKGLRRIQRRPRLVGSFFTHTKLPSRDVRMLLNQAGCL